MKTGLWMLSTTCLVALAAGCVVRRVEYVPVYEGTPGPPPQVQVQPGAETNTVVSAQAPPAPQVEMVPAAPGPALAI